MDTGCQEEMQKKGYAQLGKRVGANASEVRGRNGHEEEVAELSCPCQPSQGDKAGYHIISAAVRNNFDNKQKGTSSLGRRMKMYIT